MLKISNLSKKFGKLTALDNISLDVKEGEVFGIIGQNGAGKSTLFRCMMNYFTDYSGKISFNGKSVKEIDLKNISYLPEERSLVDSLTIKKQVSFFAELNGYDLTNEELQKYLDDFEVKGSINDKIKKLSKGNMQKVQIICALIYKPKIIILDEPFSGLDPHNIQLVQKQILEKKSDDAIMLFSSHDMSNVEEISNRLMMIKNGKKVLYGDIYDIRNSYPRRDVVVEIDKDLHYLEEYDYVEEVTKVENSPFWNIRIDDESKSEELFNELYRKYGFMKVFSQKMKSLNEIFSEEVKK